MGAAWRRAYPRKIGFREAYGRDAPFAAWSVDLLSRLARNWRPLRLSRIKVCFGNPMVWPVDFGKFDTRKGQMPLTSAEALPKDTRVRQAISPVGAGEQPAGRIPSPQ